MTANGVEVENADSLTGSQELRVYVGDDGGDDVRLFFNGVEYTPLFRGEGYLGYLLGDNGLCRIYSGESIYVSFSVTGNDAPVEMGLEKYAWQSPTIGTAVNDGVNRLLVDSNCINYPYKQSEDFPAFIFRMAYTDDVLEADFTLNNCSIIIFTDQSQYDRVFIKVTVVDTDLPAYIQYKGFIIAVFNYTN